MRPAIGPIPAIATTTSFASKISTACRCAFVRDCFQPRTKGATSISAAAMMANLDILVRLEPICCSAQSAVYRSGLPPKVATSFVRGCPHFLFAHPDSIKRYTRFLTEYDASEERIEHSADESDGVRKLHRRRGHAADLGK